MRRRERRCTGVIAKPRCDSDKVEGRHLFTRTLVLRKGRFNLRAPRRSVLPPYAHASRAGHSLRLGMDSPLM